MKKRIKKFFQPKLKLLKGTRFVSFLFIMGSIAIASGILFAANLYFNIDTGEVVMEEIKRVTRNIRATAGIIVGGAVNQDPAPGIGLQVAAGDVLLSAADQKLRFSGGTGFYIGLRAPITVTTTKNYILPHHGMAPPSPDHVLTWQTGGQLQWRVATAVGGVGDITAVGDVTSGPAFTGADLGNSLWFEGTVADAFEIQLTAENPLADHTITLPALTGRVALTDAALLDGSILFAGAGRVTQNNANLFWNNALNRLGIGTSTPAHMLDVRGTIRTGGPGMDGQLRIFSEQVPTAFEIVFQPHATMTMNTIYTLPVDDGAANQVLVTDGTGILAWQSVAGIGGVTGTGTVNRLARWTGISSIGDGSILDQFTGIALTIAAGGDITIANNLTVSGAGTHAFAGTLDPHHVAGFTLTGPITGSGNPSITGIGQFAGLTAVLTDSVTAPLFRGTGPVTVQSGGTGDIILDPATGRIRLATGDWIETFTGYQIGRAGTKILREMIPILGFDLPAQTATTSFVPLSRILEAYPFAAALPGTTRVHRFVIRYADATTTAATTWRVWNVTGATTTATFSVPASPSIDLGKGVVHTTAHIPIPIHPVGDPIAPDWRLDVMTPGTAIRVYQIFLAAYDQII